MASLVAVCADVPAVAPGDDFADCTLVQWQESTAWEVPDLTPAQWGEVITAMLGLFVTIAVIRIIRKTF